MAALSLLSVTLGFLLRLGAYCKLASSYLRLPAKCLADLAPCQLSPLLVAAPRSAPVGVCGCCLQIVSETHMIHFLWHIFNIPEPIEFKERSCGPLVQKLM